jgi:hypothetical protein
MLIGCKNVKWRCCILEGLLVNTKDYIYTDPFRNYCDYFETEHDLEKRIKRFLIGGRKTLDE